MQSTGTMFTLAPPPEKFWAEGEPVARNLASDLPWLRFMFARELSRLKVHRTERTDSDLVRVISKLALDRSAAEAAIGAER